MELVVEQYLDLRHLLIRAYIVSGLAEPRA
jgi:hypothetical protein